MNIIIGETLVRKKTSFGMEAYFSTIHHLVKCLALLGMGVSRAQFKNQQHVNTQSGLSPGSVRISVDTDLCM